MGSTTSPAEQAPTELALQRRGEILQLEQAMLGLPDQLDMEKETPLRHFFAPGAYAREMTIPAGTLIVGKIHRHAHINIISQGRVRVATEFGEHELVAPHTFVSEPGTKRAVLALEDTIWTTIHVTESTDLAEIEREVIAPSYDALENAS